MNKWFQKFIDLFVGFYEVTLYLCIIGFGIVAVFFTPKFLTNWDMNFPQPLLTRIFAASPLRYIVNFIIVLLLLLAARYAVSKKSVIGWVICGLGLTAYIVVYSYAIVLPLFDITIVR